MGIVPALVLLGGGVWVVRAVWRSEIRMGLIAGIATAGVAYAMIYSAILPRSEAFWMSRTAGETLALLKPPPPVIGAVGYGEPSLVFLTRTDLAIVQAGAGADLLAGQPGAVVWVTDREEAAFTAALGQKGITSQVIAEFRGYHYSKGRWVTMRLHRRGA